MMDIPKTHLVQPSEINRNAPKINLQGKQCDQMLEYKVAQFRRKVSQIFSTAVFTQIGIFSQKAKKCPIFGLLLQENLSSRLFKNRPILSNWAKKFYGTNVAYPTPLQNQYNLMWLIHEYCQLSSDSNCSLTYSLINCWGGICKRPILRETIMEYSTAQFTKEWVNIMSSIEFIF